MKALVIIGLAVVLGALGYYGISRGHKTDKPHNSHNSHPSHKSHPPDPPSTTLTNFTEVFQKAFWKRPTAEDKILHAERREWSDADGVRKWQWFIAVQPSPELVKHLIEANAFNLVSGKALPDIHGAPDWFVAPSGKFEVFSAPSGSMCVLFNRTENHLYATDTGGGFHPGAPEAVAPAPQPSAPTGRLPGGAPPNSPGP